MARREDLVPRTVEGRYELRDLLGQGGMGSVWRAHDLLLRRPVAVKEIEFAAHLEPGERLALRQRVLREAQAAARVNHPHLVAIFDVVEEDGTVYLVQELVDAPTLKALVVDRGPMAPEDAAAIGVQLVEALAAAHRGGVIHRDVKPANVMVLSDGAVKLTDFGIASMHGDPKLTATGAVVGSPSYMAPEHALGGRAGPPADLWGLGATLYWAVEGEAPFGRGDTLATLTSVVHDRPRPTARAGRLGPTLEALLRKDPEARPSAEEVAVMLARVAEPPSATPPRPTVSYPGAALAGWPPFARRGAEAGAPVVPGAPSIGVAQAGPGVTTGPGRGLGVATGPASPTPGRSGRTAAVVAAVMALVAVATVAFVTRGSGDGSAAAPADPAPSPTARPVDAPAPVASVAPTTLPAIVAPTPAPPTTAPTPALTIPTTPTTVATVPSPSVPATPAVTGPLPGVQVPAEWEMFTDGPTGYVVATPPGWTVKERGRTRRDFVDPATGSYLRIEWTDKPGPSPVGAWEQLSKSLAGSKADYREISIVPTTFGVHDAALWEYSYREQGAALHAYDLGMVIGDRYGFALNFQTREDRWAASQPLWEQLKAGFRPPPAA